MINLALADLAHILSLPLRIYYYFTHTWPFGRGICLFCFYLKYLNMYAAIVFLVRKLEYCEDQKGKGKSNYSLEISHLVDMNQIQCMSVHIRGCNSSLNQKLPSPQFSNLLPVALNLVCNFHISTFFCFKVCISMQRCVFLLKPFFARRWRRRYDLLISITVWLLVGIACSPFILMRSSNTTNTGIGTQAVYNMSSSLDAISTQRPLSYTRLYVTPLRSTRSGFQPAPSPSSTKVSCFKDLPMRHLPFSLAVTTMVLAELLGFLIPLACISYSSIRIARSLNQEHTQEQQKKDPSKALNSSARYRFHSVSSYSQTDRYSEKQTNTEKRRALLMVLGCSGLFLLCFTPYHINFLLYLMVSQDIVSNCATRVAVRQFHPVSLCLASLSCCLNPVLYYFLTAEFRLHFSRRTSSFTSSLLSSPISSPTQRPAQRRMTSLESSCSDRE